MVASSILEEEGSKLHTDMKEPKRSSLFGQIHVKIQVQMKTQLEKTQLAT